MADRILERVATIDSEAAEAAKSFLRYKRSKQDALSAAHEMVLVSRSLSREEEQRRELLDAARARAVTQIRVFVKPPEARQPLICVRMNATDTVSDLAAAAESRCTLTPGSHRLAWGGKVVPSGDALPRYDTSSMQPFRLVPVVSAASKTRIHALARPTGIQRGSSQPDQAVNERTTRAPRAPVTPSARLVELATPRAVVPQDRVAEHSTGPGGGRTRTRPCTPRVHALAQPVCATQKVSRRVRSSASLPGRAYGPQPESLESNGRRTARVPTQKAAASSSTAVSDEETAALAFIHEAIALAKALMAEGRSRELSSEQRHICYTDAADSLSQAVDVAEQTEALCTEELDQLTRMLDLAQKQVTA